MLSALYVLTVLIAAVVVVALLNADKPRPPF